MRKTTGQLAKTDRLDAQLIALVAERAHPKLGLLKQIAVELAGQYSLTCKTDSAEAKLILETKEKGVKLSAPARIRSK